MVVHGRHDLEFEVVVNRRSLVREGDVPGIVRGISATERRRGVTGVIVSDRITEDAKKRLRAKSFGWLDLRGDLHLEGPGVFVDARVKSVQPHVEMAKEPLTGAVGLELASLLLMNPVRTFGVRQAATELGRAPSSVSQELRRLRESGLIDSQSRPSCPDLFRALARRWRPESVDLASLPRPGDAPINEALRLGLDDPANEMGWALGDTLAAIAYGAPVSASGGYPPDLYAPDHMTLRRAKQLLGTAASREGRACTLRVAPVPLVTSHRVDWVAPGTLGWPLVHPLFVALDLAQDPDRGSEVLAGWDPPGRWHRVW
jgi:DNA-binding transcriptional ArsR family regulator